MDVADSTDGSIRRDKQETRKTLRKVIRKKKLDRVLDPCTRDTIHSIVQQNEMIVRMREMRDLPDDHKKEVALIREEDRLDSVLRDKFQEVGIPDTMIRDQPRAIKQLNLLERLKGGDLAKQWSGRIDQADKLVALLRAPAPTNTIH